MKILAGVKIYNEFNILRRCLDSLKWCDDVIVVDGKYTGRHGDDLSTDGSRELCMQYSNVTLLDLPHVSSIQKNTLIFNQSQSADDVCLLIDADCYITGDTDAFRNTCKSRTPFNGTGSLYVLFKHWYRHPELNGQKLMREWILNPYRAYEHPHNHGWHMRDGKKLWSVFNTYDIMIVHDDSYKLPKRLDEDARYNEENERREIEFIANYKFSIRDKISYGISRWKTWKPSLLQKKASTATTVDLDDKKHEE